MSYCMFTIQHLDAQQSNQVASAQPSGVFMECRWRDGHMLLKRPSSRQFIFVFRTLEDLMANFAILPCHIFGQELVIVPVVVEQFQLLTGNHLAGRIKNVDVGICHRQLRLCETRETICQCGTEHPQDLFSRERILGLREIIFAVRFGGGIKLFSLVWF